MVGEHSRRKILESVTLGVAALSGLPQASSQSVDIERVGPAQEVSVVPGTQVLFEVAVQNLPGNYRTYLTIDGEEQFAEPDAFYGGLDRGERDVVTHTFDTRGTHRVRYGFRDGDGNRLGSVEWTVRVTDDGNRPPRVERLKPKAKVVELPGNQGQRRQFALRATDPDGELDRVVWWLGQCDEVVAVSSLSGNSDSASVTFDARGGCPLWPAVVGESGAISWDEGWILRREDRSGHYIRIQSEGGGVANYGFTTTGSIRQMDQGDIVNENSASGHVGPSRGEDLFYFQGHLTQLSVDGPATVWIDGEQIDPATYGDNVRQQHVLEIVSDGGGVANYEFSVSGSVRQCDSGDDVSGNEVSGRVGPQGGTDTFIYTGSITSFRLRGPATVYKNGVQVNPDTLG